MGEHERPCAGRAKGPARKPCPPTDGQTAGRAGIGQHCAAVIVNGEKRHAS